MLVTHSYNINILYISVLGLEGFEGLECLEGLESLNNLEDFKSLYKTFLYAYWIWRVSRVWNV